VVRIAVLDQEHSLQPAMAAAKARQLLSVVRRIFLRLHDDFHPPGVNDQE
jgi:hypothetical protein